MRPQTEFDEAMREALTNDIVWHDLTATREGMDKADVWLKATNIRVCAQLADRKGQYEADFHTTSGPTRTRITAEYLTWKRKTVAFHDYVKARRGQLAKMIRTDNITHHAGRTTAQQRAMYALAEAIYAHEHGDGDPDDLDAVLWDVLDQVTIPEGRDGEVTLRTVLERRHAAHQETA